MRPLVADGKRVVGGENRLEIAAGKVHDAGVAGGDVTVGIARGNPERMCLSGGSGGRELGYRQDARGRRGDDDAGGCR